MSYHRRREQHDRKEYVKLDIFFMRWFAEERTKKPLSFEKKGDQKGKEKAKPSTRGKNKGKLVLMKNVGPPPPSKGHSTIDKSLKKPIEAEPIFAIKILESEEGSLNKHQKNIRLAEVALQREKAQNFLGDRSNEIVPKVMEMLPIEVQSAISVHYKYWTDKYSSYVETYDSMDILEASLTL
ncbi:Hypothetical predicted protein [Olea europaea subsp. europaea]|uniref:Uncharacterized protein n=1 Tax=Olea europaea subsp. europaea TaxID=158383 RepID=A0A8S0SDH7_OLEEU|nr:Hypothetical predicted protein [Olea europaea subsp. europaea]